MRSAGASICCLLVAALLPAPAHAFLVPFGVPLTRLKQLLSPLRLARALSSRTAVKMKFDCD